MQSSLIFPFLGLLLVASVAVCLYFAPDFRQWLGGWRVFAAGAAVLLSHYVLDSFYNHGVGIAIFWPYSDARLALPIPWFSTLNLSQPWLAWSNVNWHTVKTCLIELACYGSLLGAVIWLRRRWHPRTNDQVI